MTNDASGFIFDDLEVAQSSESLGDITAPSKGVVFYSLSQVEEAFVSAGLL
jgi:hypothetical protein